MNLYVNPRWASSTLALSNTAYIDCGAPAILSNFTSFTIEAWVNPSNINGFQAIAGNNDNATGGQYQLFLSDGYVIAYVGIAPYVIQSASPISTNTWHHIATTFDGKNLILYVDGVIVAQNTFSGVMSTKSTNVFIGAGSQSTQPVWFFQGQIGRVMIWNSARDKESVLNDAVLINVYNATQNADLILYTDFSVMPTVDGSGNNIPLTYKNGAQYSFNVPSVLLTSGAYVDCGIFSDYSRPGNLPYTIEGWFFPTVASSGTLISYGKNQLWEYQVLHQNNQVVARRNSDTLQIVSNSAVIPNSYYHFAVTYDDTVKALSLYINGNLQCVDYFPAGVAAVTGGSVLVGAQFNNSGVPTGFFNGSIQNLRIWNVCLEQSEVFQWMSNDVVTDTRLISNYDFTVNPPIDTTDKALLGLKNGAVQTLQQVNVGITDPIAQIGVIKSINAVYLNQEDESPVAPPTNVSFAASPVVFSADHREESWKQFDTGNNHANQRKQFDAAYDKAQQLMNKDPRLSKVFTRTDIDGVTRIVHHGLKGDTLMYEAATDAVSDCILWWIQFVYLLTVGFLQAVGLAPTTGNIATKIYNLVRGNTAAMNAITSLTGKTLTASAGITFIGVVYQQGLMWTIMKFVFTSAGWYALFWVLKKVIAIVTGLEAAALLAGFIVWASQLTILSLNYNSKCGSTLTTVNI
jgi:hypothetical protein